MPSEEQFHICNMLTGETELLIGQTNTREDTLFTQRQTEVISKPVLTLWTPHLLLYNLVQLTSQL